MKIRVTAERLRRGWSQTELARRSRLTQSIISLIETRRLTRPWASYLSKLADALGWLEDPERLLDPVEIEIHVASVIDRAGRSSS